MLGLSFFLSWLFLLFYCATKKIYLSTVNLVMTKRSCDKTIFYEKILIFLIASIKFFLAERQKYHYIVP